MQIEVCCWINAKQWERERSKAFVILTNRLKCYRAVLNGELLNSNHKDKIADAWKELYFVP